MNTEIKTLVENIDTTTLADAAILFGNAGAEAAACVLKGIAQDEDASRGRCVIDNLLTPLQSLDSATQLWGSLEYAETLLQVTVDPDGTAKDARLVWAFEEGPMSTFEIDSTPEEGDPDGVVGLTTHPLEHTLKAACMEAAISPGVFTEGLELKGRLNLYATRVDSLGSGREEEEGAYGLVCDAANPTHATVSGRIWDVEKVEVAGLSLTHITIDTVPLDGPGTLFVHLYLHDDVLDGKTPDDGDYITCTGSLHFTPDHVVKEDADEVYPCEELRTIKDIHNHLRYDMGLVYCIDMDGDTRLDYNNGPIIFMSFKDAHINSLNSGAQTDVQLGAVRFFSQLKCHADTAKIYELCNEINERMLFKAYYNSRGRIIVEHCLLPDGDCIPAHLFEFTYKRFLWEADRINDKIRELMAGPDEDDDDDDIDLDALLQDDDDNQEES